MVAMTGGCWHAEATLQRLDRCQNCLGVPIDLHLRENVGDVPVPIEHKRRPLDPDRRLPVHVLLLQDTEGLTHPAVHIRQQWGRQAVLVRKLPVRRQ